MLCTSELYERKRELEIELSEIRIEIYEFNPEFDSEDYGLFLDRKALELSKELDRINAILLPLEELI